MFKIGDVLEPVGSKFGVVHGQKTITVEKVLTSELFQCTYSECTLDRHHASNWKLVHEPTDEKQVTITLTSLGPIEPTALEILSTLVDGGFSVRSVQAGGVTWSKS